MILLCESVNVVGFDERSTVEEHNLVGTGTALDVYPAFSVSHVE